MQKSFDFVHFFLIWVPNAIKWIDDSSEHEIICADTVGLASFENRNLRIFQPMINHLMQTPNERLFLQISAQIHIVHPS